MVAPQRVGPGRYRIRTPIAPAGNEGSKTEARRAEANSVPKTTDEGLVTNTSCVNKECSGDAKQTEEWRQVHINFKG